MSELAINVWFQKLRWRTASNGLRLLRERSLVRIITIFFCSLLVWVSLFAISYFSFHEMRVQWKLPLNHMLLEFLLDTLFLSLMLLLIFSTGIIVYSSLFSSPEASFLLSTPLPADQIFAYKLQGAIAFSSWAFVLLGSPILIAYGLTVENGAPWFYYPGLLLYFLGFVLIPGTLGALVSLVLVNIVPRDRKQLAVLSLLVLALPLVMIGRHWMNEVRGIQIGTRDWFSTILGELDFMRSRWLPSHWIAQGVQSLALNESGRAAYYQQYVN